jgi:membrane-bound lytic murein transglycosylase D
MNKWILIFFLCISAVMIHAQPPTIKAKTTNVEDSFVRNKGIKTDTFVMPPKNYFPVPAKESYFKNIVGKQSINTKPLLNSYEDFSAVAIPMHPLEESFYKYYAGKFRNHFESMKKWGRSYFDIYDAVLPQYGIPIQLKYLSVIESDLNPRCISWAGAVGPWQLMPDEADRFGLIRTTSLDERMDVYKSTHVACKLLKELYEQFGNWLLVIAAYNGGPNRMKRILNKTGTKDFFKLDYLLPIETQNHVKKFIAVHYIMEGNGGYCTMTPDEINKFKMGNTPNASAVITPYQASKADSVFNIELVQIFGYYNSVVLANTVGINIDEFNRFNPGFDALVNNNTNGFPLRLPALKMNMFKAKRLEILQASVQQRIQKADGKKPSTSKTKAKPKAA